MDKVHHNPSQAEVVCAVQFFTYTSNTSRIPKAMGPILHPRSLRRQVHPYFLDSHHRASRPHPTHSQFLPGRDGQ
jgi:hypothetical protein